MCSIALNPKMHNKITHCTNCTFNLRQNNVNLLGILLGSMSVLIINAYHQQLYGLAHWLTL